MFSRLSLDYSKKFILSAFHKQSFPKVDNFRGKSTAPQERIVITDDGSTVVCWHPPKQFPYECSRPIVEEKTKPVNTVLKVENKSEFYNVFKSQDETRTREELMKITHSTKHRWFPNNTRYKKNYKRIKSDREWL